MRLPWFPGRLRRGADPEVETTPEGGARSGGPAADGLVVTQPLAPAAEAYRVIRTNLEFASPDAALRVLLVTSATPGEGKTTTAANLAAALAQGGRRVLCVDADLRRAELHRRFGVPSQPGLSTVLVGRKGWEEVCRPVPAVPGLTVLPAGPLPPNPSELLGSRRFADLVAAVREAYDAVVLDAPPVLGFADAVVAARQADGVILVVRAGVTRNEALTAAREALERASARLVGVVLNATRAGVVTYYAYYYYGYYAQGARQAGSAEGPTAAEEGHEPARRRLPAARPAAGAGTPGGPSQGAAGA